MCLPAGMEIGLTWVDPLFAWLNLMTAFSSGLKLGLTCEFNLGG
jgi:hypothetical protein